MQPQRQVPHAARPSAVPQTNLTAHRAPQGRTDRLALRFVKVLRLFADAIFAKRYGHRAVVPETVAAVPGMVGGLLQHLKALRHIRDDHGWIRELLDAAKKRRMHLMTFVQIAQPTRLERAVNMAGQMIFYNFYFFPYRFAPRAAHRIVGAPEEEAVVSDSQYLAGIDGGRDENLAAPQLAPDYRQLPKSSNLRDVVLIIRADEAGHRDRNHAMADALSAA